MTMQVPTALAIIYLGYVLITMHEKFLKNIADIRSEKPKPKTVKATQLNPKPMKVPFVSRPKKIPSYGFDELIKTAGVRK